MRRGAAAGVVALALCIGGTAACGGDDGGDAAAETTSTTGTTDTTGPETSAVADDLSAAVEDFCAKSEEFQALIRSSATNGAAGPVDPSTSEAASARMTELTGELATLLMTLQGQTAQMLPGDAARFQECASVFGGSPELPQ